MQQNTPNKEIATLAEGCFWCTEAVFKRLKGVLSVTPGYTGGNVENPSYMQVCTGKTGHAEAIQIVYDPSVISYNTILDVFWHTHDPTSLNRQGADTGPEYRSAIFYHNSTQKEIAEESKESLGKSRNLKGKIVTEIIPYTAFYPAEEYHREFYEKNNYSSYCQIVIDPKIKKLLSQYGEKVKEEYK